MKVRGRIRYKITFVVIPILVLTSLVIGITAYLSSSTGITGIAKEFLGYKLNVVYNYADLRNNLLVGMGMENDPDMRLSAAQTVADYAQNEIGTETGGFVMVKRGGEVPVTTLDDVALPEADIILREIGDKSGGWIEFPTGFADRVGVFIYYSEWDSFLLILEDRNVFYETVNEILRYLLIILGASIVLSSVLLLYYISKITSPINEFVSTIRNITEKMDLSKRVRIEYPDEIGVLGFYFNNMIAELESAYNQIKNYAYQTVLAKKKEEKVRFIFQKYVPQEVINSVLNLPSDSMLIGSRQEVTVLFSDIRGFTSITEAMNPEQLVLTLNAYFNEMVSLIMKNQGTVDKFIGDAIMGIFGAPMVRPTDTENAVLTSLQMMDALERFNEKQRAEGNIEFKIGVGLSTGEAIVGNIGSEQKIEYTVIGDTVNLASRLEGLTKKYHTPVIISEFTAEKIPEGKFFYRELDIVRVKGKNKPVKILQPMFSETAKELAGFYGEFHNMLKLYYKGDFGGALKGFEELIKAKSDDYLCFFYKERCEYLLANPPSNWDGVETWTTK